MNVELVVWGVGCLERDLGRWVCMFLLKIQVKIMVALIFE
jgi:hypothetical protein